MADTPTATTILKGSKLFSGLLGHSSNIFAQPQVVNGSTQGLIGITDENNNIESWTFDFSAKQLVDPNGNHYVTNADLDGTTSGLNKQISDLSNTLQNYANSDQISQKLNNLQNKVEGDISTAQTNITNAYTTALNGYDPSATVDSKISKAIGQVTAASQALQNTIEQQLGTKEGVDDFNQKMTTLEGFINGNYLHITGGVLTGQLTLSKGAIDSSNNVVPFVQSKNPTDHIVTRHFVVTPTFDNTGKYTIQFPSAFSAQSPVDEIALDFYRGFSGGQNAAIHTDITVDFDSLSNTSVDIYTSGITSQSGVGNVGTFKLGFKVMGPVAS